MNDAAVEVQVVRVSERVEALEERLDRHERAQNSSLEKIWTKLDDIGKELRGRPTWGTALLITSLVGALVGLATFILTKGG